MPGSVAPSTFTPTRTASSTLRFRHPKVSDGARVWTAVQRIGTLDLNSPYAYLLLTTHFARTSLIAEQGGELMGFVAGYRPPESPATWFVWQVGVLPEARGRGMGQQLLLRSLGRLIPRGVKYLEATVTPDNTASRRLFQSTAQALGVPCNITAHFTNSHFPATLDHAPEECFRIGPVTATLGARALART